MKVLITGPSGRLGPHIVEPFRSLYEVTTFDLPGRGGDFEGDLLDIEPLREAMRGVDAVVHLAAVSDEAPFIEKLVPSNVVGLFNVLEAARLEKVKRFVFASSIQATGRRPNKDANVETDVPPRPNSLYGATKVMGEVMGRWFHDEYGMEFIALRIGAFQPYDSEWLRHGWARDIWLSPRDAASLIRASLEKEDVGYAVVNGTSKTPRVFLSLDSAKEILGWEPEDDALLFFATPK